MATGAVAAAAALVLGVYVARGAPGGETKKTLSFSGTLTDDGVAMDPQPLTFIFKTGALTCEVETTSGPIDEVTGSFQTEIDISGCPTSLFDGSDATVDVKVGETTVVPGQPISAVPYAKYADKVGSPDCPVGYERDPGAAAAHIVCTKGSDEIVKVGFGPSAFWIDRYEASVWQEPDGTGEQYGASEDDYPETFGDNGQALTKDALVYAVSKAGVPPSAHITWFQASLACAASGKRLPTGREWLLAATGTNDPGVSNGANGSCVTQGSKRDTGAAGAAIACASIWGAEDMIGNLWEWTDEWYAGLGDSGSAYTAKSTWPDTSYREDGTWNIMSAVHHGVGAGIAAHLPAAAIRGGGPNGFGAGAFALALNHAPSDARDHIGFRCVVPR